MYLPKSCHSNPSYWFGSGQNHSNTNRSRCATLFFLSLTRSSFALCRYEFPTSSQPRIAPDLLIWNFMRDEKYRTEVTLINKSVVVLIWNFMRDEKYGTEVTLINQSVVVFIRDFMQDEKYCTEVTLINQSVAVLIWNFMRDEKYWTKVTTNQSISGSPHLELHARWKISHQVTPLNQSVVSHYVELHAGR